MIYFLKQVNEFGFRGLFLWNTVEQTNAVEPGYDDIGLWDTSSQLSDILWHQLIHRS
jgi:hypothetical protein